MTGQKWNDRSTLNYNGQTVAYKLLPAGRVDSNDDDEHHPKVLWYYFKELGCLEDL